jgi:hypothetical protein
MLAGELLAGGHAVRATTRDPGRVDALARLGVEAVVADPSRVATIACLLLGSAAGDPDELRALHGPRLEMLLTRMLDTTVRAVVYESLGTVERSVLDLGAAIVRAVCEGSLIPYALLEADPGDPAAWVRSASEAVDRVLGGATAR